MGRTLTVCLLVFVSASSLQANQVNSEFGTIRNQIYEYLFLSEQGKEIPYADVERLAEKLNTLRNASVIDAELLSLQNLIQAVLKKKENLKHKAKWEGLEPAGDSKQIMMTPGNDNCVSAYVVGNGTFSGHTTTANADGWATCEDSTSPDVWFLYSPPENSTVVFSTAGSNYPTVLSIHNPNTNGCPGDPTDQIVCDDSSGFPSAARIVLPVDADNQYLVRVSGEGDIATGSYVLTIQPAGFIRGHVINEITQTPIPNVEIFFYRQNSGIVGGTSTNSNGEYVSPELPSGTYFVRAGNDNDYVEELYDNLPCFNGSCNPNTGTPVIVNSNIIEGIDFDLNPTGSISGQVLNSDGAPLTNFTVRLSDSDGDSLGFVSTNQQGNYLFTGLDQGTYFVRTNDFGDYIDELYDNIPCPSFCDPTQGTPINVTYGNVTDGIGFELDLGGMITGAVLDSNDLTPILGGQIHVINSSGNFVDIAFPGFPTGTYISNGLAPGNYFVHTSSTQDHIEELFDDIPCAFDQCDVLNGTPVPVDVASITEGIDFLLERSGTLSGTITNESSAPLPNISVQAFHLSGLHASFTQTDENGNYTVENLFAGDYFVRTSSEYLDEAYDDIVCEFCPPGTGDPVSVVTGSNTPGIDFELSQGGIITGTIADAIALTPIFNVHVTLYNSNGNIAGLHFTDGLGQFTFSGLVSGNYFLTTNTNGNYVDELYDNIPCNFCKILNGTPIPATPGTPTTGIDLALTPAGRIEGTVKSEATGQPLPANIEIYDVFGSLVTTSFSNELGLYSARILTSGNYYVVAHRPSGYIRELYDGIHCPETTCNFALGTQISVTVGATTSGININLDIGGTISGTVTDEFTGNPLPFVGIILYDAGGIVVDSLSTNQSGFYTGDTTLLAGTYFVRTNTASGYKNELYDNLPCQPNCVVTNGDPIAVVEGSTTPNINFALKRPTVSINDVSITEGDSETQMMNFTVTLSEPTQTVVTVTFEDDDGTAFGNFDFQPVWGAVQILPQHSAAVISIPIIGDNVLEPDEIFFMRLTTAVSATIADSEGIGTILNNDDSSCPTITINPAALHDGNIGLSYVQSLSASGGAAPYSFVVSAGTLPPDLSVNTDTISGTPTTSGTFNFTIIATDADSCSGSRDYSITINEACEFGDEFEDGAVDPQKWTITKLGFTEESGNFVGTPIKKTAQALATGYTGCGANCRVITTMQSVGGFGSKVIALGWYQRKDEKLELIMNQASGKWLLRQRGSGIILAKKKVSMPISANTPYTVEISFDGSEFKVVIDGTLVMTMEDASASLPVGTFGFEVKNTTGRFGSICVNSNTQ